MTQTLDDFILHYADDFDLPVKMVYAIVQVESAHELYAWRVEPAYRYLVDVKTRKPFRILTRDERASERAPTDFPYFPHISSRDTEWWGQQCSWGPMQVMGAVAREYGFTGYLPALCGEQGVMYGCMHLKRLWDRWGDEFGKSGAIAAYNAGSPRKYDGVYQNQGYVDKVRKAMDSY